MSEHTKEPWDLELTESIAGKLDKLILEKKTEKWIGWTYEESDARRIVACVNACAGIPTGILENDDFQKVFDMTVVNETREIIANLKSRAEAAEAKVKELEAEVIKLKQKLIDQYTITGDLSEKLYELEPQQSVGCGKLPVTINGVTRCCGAVDQHLKYLCLDCQAKKEGV